MLELLQDIQGLIDAARLVLPMAGVGGGIDVKETIDLGPLIKFTLIFVASMGALFGVALALTAKRFSVKVDPRVEQITEVLAHAHCGACGYPGCAQYAEAVLNDPDLSPSLCTPGGAKTAEAVARISGKVAMATEPVFSRIMCQGGLKQATKRFVYEGIRDCRAAVLAGGGDKTCIYGCLGYGTCMRECPFNAITMSDNGLPVVDVAKCTGCRKCEKACPKKVIEILPGSKAVLVSCHSRDKGGDTKKACEVGCIACRKCEKVCPYDAIGVNNNYSRVDVAKCKVCGLCARNCPTNAIVDYIAYRSKAFVTERCIGCQKCAKVCPVDAVTGEKKQRHLVDTARCIGCGICTSNCPSVAIEGTWNYKEIADAAEERRLAKEAAKASKEIEAA